MKRRTFLKSAAAAGAAAMLPSSVLSLASGCTSENTPGWNFDEVLDRTGTWSVTSQEGIVDDDIDRSIHNLTAIGADAMCITDEMVLNIMTNKHCSV